MKSFYSITNKIYDLQDATEFDYAVAAMIATYNLPFSTDEVVDEIETFTFTVNEIFTRLRLDYDNKTYYTKKIRTSIKKLHDANVINISNYDQIDFNDNSNENNNNEIFYLSQVVDEAGEYAGFASLVCKELMNALEIPKISDRIQAIAFYVSVNQRIFRAKAEDTKADISRFINWECIATIANKYGRSRTIGLKSLQQLQKVKALSFAIVKLNGALKDAEKSSTKYVISRYEYNNSLNAYVNEKLKEGLYKSIVANAEYLQNDELKDDRYYYNEEDKEAFNSMKRVKKVATTQSDEDETIVESTKEDTKEEVNNIEETEQKIEKEDEELVDKEIEQKQNFDDFGDFFASEYDDVINKQEQKVELVDSAKVVQFKKVANEEIKVEKNKEDLEARMKATLAKMEGR
ncbi:MAG TPA: hypothetical protein DIW15_00205 [Bavariicoccus seileri]|uniref:Uncharacterized protein n=1 Tax=Bavariicoccus seileri TaxID=549685 RepID=A0A3D4S2U7_9ENTE|nr:hypothetical protein [Bavariicoccus seileri]HCS93117.1 hypothetical protein [Bavariicoccus seileri]